MDEVQVHYSQPLSASAKVDLIKRQARVLFSAYRRDEFADPDGFMAQLGVVLERYADAVIVGVTHPLTGLQRRLRQPPAIADVVQACEQEAARLERIRKLSAMKPERLPLSKAQWCNILVRPDRPRYSEMLELSRTTDKREWLYDKDGIWVSEAMWKSRS